jgi:hypothetical protein
VRARVFEGEPHCVDKAHTELARGAEWGYDERGMGMNVFLRLTLDCEPDVAWRAIANPAVFAAVSRPFLRVSSREPGGFPTAWTGDGPHRVAIRAFGVIPMGVQNIDVAFTERPGGVRMMIDSGSAVSGPMRVMHHWDHRMAVSPAPNGRTLYRDRLVVKAGVLTPVVWLSMWMFWQMRGAKLKRLAPTWN